MSVPIVAQAGSKQAAKVTGELKELLKGDIVTFKGQMFREVTAKFSGGKKQTKLVPIDWEFRINAMSGLLALGGAGLTVMLLAFGLWWSQLRVRRLTNDERVALENELAQGSQTTGWFGALNQTMIAIKTLQDGDELAAGLRSAMSQLIRVNNINALGEVNMHTLQALRKLIEKNIKRIQRELRANIKLDEREGFSFGPREATISLIGG
jgi:hypothetical protein